MDEIRGLTLIKGDNKDTGGSNGSGKSAVFEAIIWGLTGRTIRKSVEEAMIHNKAKEPLYVLIELDNGWTIFRQKRPTKLQIYYNGKEQTRESVQKTQDFLNQRFHLDYKKILTSCVFGQHNTVDFLECSLDQKRDLLNHYLGLEHIFKYRPAFKSNKNSSLAEIKVLNNILQGEEEKLKGLEEKLQFIQDHNDLPDISLNEILEVEEKIREYNKELTKTKQLIKDFKIEQRMLKDKIAKGAYREAKDCNICGTKGAIKDKQTKTDITKFRRQLKKVDQDISDKTSLREYYENYLRNNKPTISSKNYSDQLNLIRERDSYISLRDSYKQNAIEIQDKLEDLEKDVVLDRYWEQALSEKGIIKYIVQQILDYFNTQVNSYLSILSGSDYRIMFDDELKEEITSKGKQVYYISLSGGEKRRINLSVMLALLDIANMTNPSELNFILFDECAENLDNTTLTGFADLLHELKKKKDIFVITHNYKLQGLLDCSNHLTVTKKNGYSFIN
jgi:DNA repair exonuclease SbcCD ATPase subunit